MNFDAPAPRDRAAVLSHTDGLGMKVSTRQKQGATRHKRVGAKGDNSAFPAPTWPSNPVSYLRRSPARSSGSGPSLTFARDARGPGPPARCERFDANATLGGCYSVYIISSTPRTIINSGQVFWKVCRQFV